MKLLENLNRDWPMATEIRKLEARLWSRVRRDRLRVIMVTSALQGEGKSTTVAFLAAALSQHRDRKILAVDADFRSPSLGRHFDIEADTRFERYLRGEIDLDQAGYPSPIDNLDLVLASPCEGIPDALLGSARLGNAFRSFREKYDLVLLDVPALVPVADAASLIPFTDGVLLVVMAGRSSKTHLTRARELCLGMEANIIGLVVGNIQEAAPDYLDMSYYSRESARPAVDPGPGMPPAPPTGAAPGV